MAARIANRGDEGISNSGCRVVCFGRRLQGEVEHGRGFPGRRGFYVRKSYSGRGHCKAAGAYDDVGHCHSHCDARGIERIGPSRGYGSPADRNRSFVRDYCPRGMRYGRTKHEQSPLSDNWCVGNASVIRNDGHWGRIGHRHERSRRDGCGTWPQHVECRGHSSQSQGRGDFVDVSAVEFDAAVWMRRCGDDEIARGGANLATTSDFPSPGEVRHDACRLYGAPVFAFAKRLDRRAIDGIGAFDLLPACQ